MKEQALVERLSKGIASALRSTSYCVSGTLPNVSPGIDVAGVGPLSLPLKQATAKRLLTMCKQAPYGKGTETLVNKQVRDAYELAPGKFTLTNPEWNAVIQTAVTAVAERLGLPADRLEARLYKLLVYRSGGLFVKHRDSEKSERMVGSLIVVLPTPFQGGTLKVHHQSASQTLDFKEAAAGKTPCYAGFYADCEHEVATVTYGVRLCLAYNLVLKSAGRAKPALSLGGKTTPAHELAQVLAGWVGAKEPEPLVFALDHHYTQRGLSLDLLKGNDRATGELVVAAAEQADCRAYLCQVSRHLSQYADDGNYGGGRRSRWDGYDDGDDDDDDGTVPTNLEIGEVYEDDLHGAEWVDTHGKPQPFPTIPFSGASIVASTPLDEWKPTRQEYEGFTGNAGNTLDRWYHRSALCVWHRDHHFTILARGGLEFATKLLASMVQKLKKTAKKRLAEARADCMQLARGIIALWPRTYRHYYAGAGRGAPPSGFPKLLQELDDAETACQFLAQVRQRDPGIELDALIVAMCRTHGIATFATELTALFDANGEPARPRDFAWLDRLACAQLNDPDRDVVIAKLALLAESRFHQPQARQHHNEDAKQVLAMLVALIRTLLIVGDDAVLEHALDAATADTKRFPLDVVQVPALVQLIGWCRKEGTEIHPRLTVWLRSAQETLAMATVQAPQPPTDWARAASIACTCQYCRQLNALLADPTASTGRIKAAENDRAHLLDKLHRHPSDVDHNLDRSGSPYSLVFTKTQASYERQKQRYLADRKLLETVDGLLA